MLHLVVLNAALQAGLPNPLDAAIVAREPAGAGSAARLDQISFGAAWALGAVLLAGLYLWGLQRDRDDLAR